MIRGVLVAAGAEIAYRLSCAIRSDTVMQFPIRIEWRRDSHLQEQQIGK